MPEKIKKLLHLIAMSVAVIAVVIFAVIHALTALNTQYGTLVMVAYVMMFIWAVCRVIILAKEFRRMGK
jgi:hypothetical protein